MDLEFFEIPESWHLEPEKDEQQKEIENLKRQLNVLKQQLPQLSLRASDDQGANLDKLKISVTRYASPDPSQIETVMTALRERHPRRDDFSNPSSIERMTSLGFAGLKKYEPADDRKIEKYRRAYEAWLTNAEDYLKNLPERRIRLTSVGKVAFQLAHDGTEVAKSVLVEFRATPGFLILPVAAADEKRLITHDFSDPFPSPPDEPNGRYIDPFSYLADPAHLLTGLDNSYADLFRGPVFLPSSFKEAPEACYYRERRPSDFVESIRRDCSFFRHGIEPQLFEFQIQWQGDEERMRGAIHCRVAAEKIAPITKVLPVEVVFEEADIHGEIENHRPRPMKLRFRGKPPDPSRSEDS